MIQFQSNGGEIRAVIHAQEIKQVMLNLLTNALKVPDKVNRHSTA